MTSFFGVAGLCGAMVRPDLLATVESAATRRYPGLFAARHAFGLYGAGSRARADSGDALQPPGNGARLVLARARLDNRRELHRLLGLSGPVPSDAHLILAAWERWGQECVERLIGDWAFALWDHALARWVLARDATGNTALYWARQGKDALLFSTDIEILLAGLMPDLQPNPIAVAGMLAAFRDPDEHGETVYRGVSRLLPGHLLSVSGAGVQLHRWWRPEQLAPMRVADPGEHLAAFMNLYTEAVAARLPGPGGSVAATLSGGLDSGSVAMLAAGRLRESNRRLLAFVHRPLHAPSDLGPHHHGDECALAGMTADLAGNIDLTGIRSENTTLLGGIREALEIHAAPSHAAANQYWLLDIMRASREQGAGVLLTGQGGNATVSYFGTGNLLPHLGAGRFAAVWRALREDRTGLPTALKRRLAKPGLRGVRALWKRLPPFADGWQERAFINPAFALTLDLAAKMRVATTEPASSMWTGQSSVDRKLRLGLLRGGLSGAHWMELGEAYGIDVRDPTLDRRLVEFCWRTPDDLFWAHGLQRGLVRQAFQERLPAEVLYGTRRGVQSSDLNARMRDQYEELASTVEKFNESALCREWLDLPGMRRLLEQAAGRDAGSVSRSAGFAFTRALSVGLFLMRF